MISVSVYNDNKRNELNVEFIIIENVTMTIDATELNDNRNAGNISNGYVKKSATSQNINPSFILLMDI
ncbi:hypothetical protein [Citrobacter portucalensis]|uniref:hypothetical protein n=1 Tax=Citrobacter portucalensis TaxID=1639133 RepID=UPI000449FE01|nr:hypothetical protein [Citrobacter portucalensis]ETX62613.1 hypothetical protein P835_03091 [Citrobacter portucalensis]MDX6977213.1 hypothetical protein [Citrobacter portucalensis]MEB2768024.1 hypothetical protein [Citrobacter portucalensis]